ncbi:hypothetical protein [Rhodococcus tukisamuensis]|uniref:Uncharacterized protein n=1 Tax=Rhodococcus tukisamuensis TaxID=168276 RepID=A0A1G7ETR1_9NOCA|nr:hypothetical protein [Rhodococcus tukisamuensis]SDE66957.1 hypothetical protein SAMN05444580_1276 [Rhodococcus tukisamuensis]
MHLDDQLGRWIQLTGHVRDTLDPILGMMSDGQRVLVDNVFRGVQWALGDYLHAGDADAPPEGSDLAAVVGPFAATLRGYQDMTTAPGTTAELRALLSGVRDAAQVAHLALTTDDRLATQTVDEVIADFADEYRISLILALTANHALSRNVVHWQESKAADRATGDHLDVATMTFVADAGERTIPMSSLTAASTVEPLVATYGNFAASMQTLRTGGTPPPIYRMSYQQWVTNVHAAWEDTYRPRLAAAHGADDAGQPWTKNDIRSEFFNEVRQIRHDISHKQGVCVESAGNTLIGWVEPGKAIAPTPQQMLGMLDLFPYDELRRTPTRAPRTTERLPYQFDLEWIEKVKAHVGAIEPVKKKRPAVLQQIVDDWMTQPAAEPT